MINCPRRANTGITLSIAGLTSHLVANAVDSMTGLVITDLVEQGIDSPWGRMLAEFGMAGACTAALAPLFKRLQRWRGARI